MKPSSQLLAAAFLCALASSCTKTNFTDQVTLPQPTLSGIARTSAVSKHRAGLLKAEYLGARRARTEGRTIVYNDKRTLPASAYVARDPRRGGKNGLTYVVSSKYCRDAGCSPEAQAAAIVRALGSWSRSNCAQLTISRHSYEGPLGYVAASLGYGGYQGYIADIVQGGFLDGSFFDLLTPGGSQFVLAVTFTFIYFDENGVPTDLDGNGKNDVAFTETYYNDQFGWSTTPGGEYDIESVVLHETGHSLGLSHYGKGVIQRDGRLKFSPAAVMNAIYQGTRRTLTGADKSLECMIWKNWKG